MITANSRVSAKPPDLADELPRLAGIVDLVSGTARVSRIVSRTNSMASPWVTLGTPEKVTALSCWKRVSDCGTTVSLMLATVEACTSEPSPARM